MRICSYCVMPNHWHFVLWPQHDGDLAAFMQRLTVTHVTRWQKNRRRVGEGHVYQGRFKSFPVETDDYFYQLVRYVERNALRANLVPRAEEWRWSSLWRREHGSPAEQTLLAEWPMPCPRHWLRYVNEAETESELEALRRSVHRGQPFGSGDWVFSRYIICRAEQYWTCPRCFAPQATGSSVVTSYAVPNSIGPVPVVLPPRKDEWGHRSAVGRLYRCPSQATSNCWTGRLGSWLKAKQAPHINTLRRSRRTSIDQAPGANWLADSDDCSTTSQDVPKPSMGHEVVLVDTATTFLKELGNCYRPCRCRHK